MKTVDIKGKPYVEVNERIKEFRTNPKYAAYSLESEIIQLENGICTIKAIIKNDQERIIATGLAQEKENSSFINKTSFIENCETSAWGRALGNLGIGIDTSIASAEEVINAINNQENSTESPIFNELVDIDLVEGLKAINDKPNLVKYYNENRKNAKNQLAFGKEYTKRLKEIGA